MLGIEVDRENNFVFLGYLDILISTDLYSILRMHYLYQQAVANSPVLLF